MDDLISRQAAIDAMTECYWSIMGDEPPKLDEKTALYVDLKQAVKRLPTAEPTLYGYKIEHLAYIATVMEKEGVTAEYAVRTFDDIGRVVKMLIEEVQAKVEEALNERFN